MKLSISPVKSDISMDERMYRVDSRNCIRDVAIILGVCFVVFFYGLGDSAFTDKHEAREALVISAIYDAGNWVLPLRNGSELPFKPPLFHWLSALFTNSVNRVDEVTTRFPSALVGTLGVLLTYITGTILWGRSAGLVSALVLLTSYEWRQTATQARVDMTLTFALLCCFLFFFYLYETDGGRDRRKACLFGFPLGKKRFRLPQEVPSRHRYRHVWFGCRLLVRAGSLAGREGICFHSAQRKSAHPCRRRTVPSPSFLLVPSGFSPTHRPVESVFSPHEYLSLPLSTPSI